MIKKRKKEKTQHISTCKNEMKKRWRWEEEEEEEEEEEGWFPGQRVKEF